MTVVANLTFVNTRGMNFGEVFSNAGPVRSSNATSAEWIGSVDPGNTIGASFVPPSALTRVGGGGNGSVPFACNTISSAMLFGADAGSREFNPYVRSGPYAVGTGHDFSPALGRENSAGNTATIAVLRPRGRRGGGTNRL